MGINLNFTNTKLLVLLGYISVIGRRDSVMPA